MTFAPIDSGEPTYAGMTAKKSLSFGNRTTVRSGSNDSPRANAAKVLPITSMHSRIDSSSPKSCCDRTIIALLSAHRPPRPWEPAPRSEATKASLLGHERIRVVERRREGLLDRPGADPANEIELRSRLV